MDRGNVLNLIVLLGFLVVFDTFCSLPPRLDYSLVSKWPSTPLYAEMGEFIRQRWPDRYIPFAESVMRSECNHNEIDCVLLDAKSIINDDRVLDIAGLYLLSRTYSPFVEMTRRIATKVSNESNFFFIIFISRTERFVSSDPKEIIDSLGSSSYRPRPFLDQKDFTARDEVSNVVAYGDWLDPEFIEAYRILNSSTKPFNCLLKPFIRNISQQPVSLSGYGVALKLKSTEYKAMDESQGNLTSKETDNGPARIVRGFDFKRLFKVYHEDQDALSRFKVQLNGRWIFL
ncbi:hypothetical protein ACOME3_001968 [Neoechinorhynchus agilis]